MRAFIIYDGTASSRANLERACGDATHANKPAAFLILVTETVPAPQPLAAKYPELEGNSEQLLKEAFSVINRHYFKRITGEVLRCRPNALTLGIAERVNSWQAENVYLPTSFEAPQTPAPRHWWQRWRPRPEPALSSLPRPLAASLDLNGLIRLIPKAIVIMTDADNCVMRLSCFTRAVEATTSAKLSQTRLWVAAPSYPTSPDAFLQRNSVLDKE